jgi:hypothetical protein
MVFSKSFPKKKLTGYPEWEEVRLSDEEESAIDEHCRQENIVLMNQCIEDARNILKEKRMMDHEEKLMDIAIALFDKRASHTVHWKEKKAKEKFDSLK